MDAVSGTAKKRFLVPRSCVVGQGDVAAASSNERLQINFASAARSARIIFKGGCCGKIAHERHVALSHPEVEWSSRIFLAFLTMFHLSNSCTDDLFARFENQRPT